MSQLTATFNTFFQKQHSDAKKIYVYTAQQGSPGKWSMHFRRGRRRVKAAAASDFVSNLSKPFRRYIASTQVCSEWVKLLARC